MLWECKPTGKRFHNFFHALTSETSTCISWTYNVIHVETQGTCFLFLLESFVMKTKNNVHFDHQNCKFSLLAPSLHLQLAHASTVFIELQKHDFKPVSAYYL